MNVQGPGAIATQPLFPSMPRPATDAPQKGTPTDFGGTLEKAVDAVNLDQQESAASVRQLLSGASQDVLPVVQAVARADMSFRLLVAVRNKVIEAYKQTMNMQV
jgi:flagellar hook-basal body complex protein FliE